MSDIAIRVKNLSNLARFDRYQIEGRYPDLLPAALGIEAAREELEQARGVFEWLRQQL